MAVAFAGTAPFGAAILEHLLDAGEQIALVISQPDRPAGRGRAPRTPPVAQLARERGIPLIQPERASDEAIVQQLRDHDINVVLVAAFGQLIREPLLSAFLLINAHASRLPAYRGAAPIERAIMAGETETAVCIMQIEAGLDTGPVAYELPVAIGPDDDAGMIFARAAQAGARGMARALREHHDGTLSFTPQPSDGASYAAKIDADTRAVDASVSARELHDQVRALAPHIGAVCQLDGQRLTIWQTALTNESRAAGEPGSLVRVDDRLYLVCGDVPVELVQVQPAGKRRMLVRDWLRGVRELPAQIDPLPDPASAP